MTSKIASYPHYRPQYISVITMTKTNRYQREQRNLERKERIRKREKLKVVRQFFIQKMIGLIMIALCVLSIIYRWAEETDGTLDVTYLFIIVPLGLFMVITKYNLFKAR